MKTLCTTRIVKGPGESKGTFEKRYSDKMIELDYVSASIDKDFVDINYYLNKQT